jgi:hypothetical protein
MSIRVMLAAAAFAVTAAAPAVASESPATPNHAIGFLVNGGQAQRPLVEGRNSDRVVVETDRARAAAVQNFAPVDTRTTLEGAR